MVRINNMATTAFQNVEAPTPISTSDTNVLATSGFVRTWLNSQNIVINAVLSYTISAIKIFFKISTNNVFAPTGAFDPPMTIGSSTATSVNVLSGTSLAGKLQLLGTTQALLPLLTAGIPTVGWAFPIVTISDETTKYQVNNSQVNGAGIGSGIATTINFPVAFSEFCEPIIIGSSLNAVPVCVILSQPVGVAPHLGFGATFNLGIGVNRNLSYIAVGY
jgi:hypothetical protein